MHTTMPEAVTDFGASAAAALRRAGGIGLARDAETGEDAAVLARKALASVGLDDLDPRADLDSAAAAAELCRVAGAHAAPCPVPGLLLRDAADRPFALVAAVNPVIDHAAAAPVWRAATVAGAAFEARPAGATRSRLSPFAQAVDLAPLDGGTPAADVRLALVLGAFQLLGMGERALELAIEHTRDRTQFGHALSHFQVIRHGIADLSVELEGLALVCRFALWRVFDERGGSLADALAAKGEAQRVVRRVLRTAQQYHGAAGLTDEYDISVLVRHAQPALRLPADHATTMGLLRAAIEESGFDGPYAPAPAREAV